MQSGRRLPNTGSSTVISGFRRGVNEIFALLGCYTRSLVLTYRRFGTTYRFRLQGTSSPKTSVNNCQSTLRKIPEERRSYRIMMWATVFLPRI